jgi:hypothetical protein
MPSPFPGMDPYLEQPELWTDFHGNLAPEIQGRLNQVIQPRYLARLTPYVTYETIEVGERRSVRPDLGVVGSPRGANPARGATATIAPAPAHSAVPMEVPLTLHRVEIRRVGTQQLVTVIEILSPGNKTRSHDAFEDYRRTRRDLLRSAVHLLEIDLLRAGERPPLTKPVPAAPYYICLAHADRRPDVDVWPIQIGDPLPVLPVPLLEPDPPAPLDLGAAVAAIYDRCAYGPEIDDTQPPPPPRLSDEERRVVDALLRSTRIA